jgi:hypothetical protein
LIKIEKQASESLYTLSNSSLDHTKSNYIKTLDNLCAATAAAAAGASASVRII